MARQLSPSRGRVKWPGIRLGEAIISPDIFAESILVDDMTEENLLRALVIPTDGSGGAPLEESERFDTRASRNASYHFRSDVRDGIKGGQLHREETRRGAQVCFEYRFLWLLSERAVLYLLKKRWTDPIRIVTALSCEQSSTRRMKTDTESSSE